MKKIQVTNVRFTPAAARESTSGLLGWVSFTLNGSLKLDGIIVRKTRGRRLTLSFPYRQDRYGHDHHYIRPLDDSSRRVIERQIFQALRLEGVA